MKKVTLIILLLSIRLYPSEISSLAISFAAGVENHLPLKSQFNANEMFQTANLDYGLYVRVGRNFKFGGGTGGIFLLGPSAKFVDFFSTGHIAFYPFQDYISIVGTIGLSPTFFILNNISFLSSIKLSADIPIVREHYITLSTGVFYRGFIPMIDYIDFKSYRQNLSSYFVGLEYKFLIKAKKEPMKKPKRNFIDIA